jgi:hypothetical protein
MVQTLAAGDWYCAEMMMTVKFNRKTNKYKHNHDLGWNNDYCNSCDNSHNV